jgi:uncharacterized membrane protein (TIGR02234 family)
VTGEATGPAVGGPVGVQPAARAPRAGRARGRWVLLLLVLAGAVGLTALPVWVRATAGTPVSGDLPVTVSGSQAAPGVVAAALVLLAAAAAVGLVGRFGRWVVVVVVAGAGALVLSSALAARTGATAAAERVAAEQTGVSRLVGEPQVGPWPLVAALLGVLVVAGAVGLARASARWAAPSDRHERTPTASGEAAAPAAPTALGAASPAAPEDERATWDALTRGDDPT